MKEGLNIRSIISEPPRPSLGRVPYRFLIAIGWHLKSTSPNDGFPFTMPAHKYLYQSHVVCLGSVLARLFLQFAFCFTLKVFTETLDSEHCKYVH